MSTIPLYDAPKVGGDILAYCAKCKGEFAHVVVSMVDNKPAKVVCKICKGQHKFKRIGDVAAKATRKPRTAGPKKTVVRADEYWDEQMAKQKGKPMKPYNAKEAFLKGEIINHSVFGVGIIGEVKATKMVVLFRVGEKILVHGLS